MALIAVVTRDRAIQHRVRSALDPHRHDVMGARNASAARRHLRERPVAGLVLDPAVLAPGRAVPFVEGLRLRFPSVPLGVVATADDLQLLHELGRVGLRHLLVLEEGGARTMRRFVHDLLAEAAPARVARSLGPLLGRAELHRVRLALEVSHRRPGAQGLADLFGVSRPHLSRVLRSGGLPSAGHLMGWARLMHAGHWLPDPGRSGESVGRQLEYANGSTFRRALRNYVDATPSEVAGCGGLDVVVDAFMARTGLVHTTGATRWVA